MKRSYKILNYKEGMKIDKNCIIRNMPSEVYHSLPALSNSGLKTLIDCPAKYYYKYLSGEYEPKERPSFKIGKAVHCYLLEGRKKFEQTYWHNPYNELTKPELIDLLKTKHGYDDSIKKYLVVDLMQILLDENGITPKEIHLNKSELNQVVCMTKTAKNDTKTKNALSQKGESELSIFWKDEKTGVMLKCRPDFMPYDCLNVPDYKTTESANPRNFYKKFIEYGYHIQAAMYRMGIKAVTGIEVQNFFFIAQEKEPPYITQIYLNCDELLTYGEKAIYNAIEKYKECEEKGLWGGYSDKIIELSLDLPPEDLLGSYDKEQGICFAPKWIDSELIKYEV
ncbi:MAG: PD-(D/E)XK nuclease-like domain-containing protein [Candidatus Gastranaerophilales bacterium]|nr:PD-(D/E)XK nuclease-like domain-containing protein [Candidatus Gastranaerophilales bacterium]